MIHVYYYPREVARAVHDYVLEPFGDHTSTLSSSTFVPLRGCDVLPVLVHLYYPKGGSGRSALGDMLTENYVKI